MSCRVGMAKWRNLSERILYWQATEGYTKSEILHQGLTYETATRLEREEAQKRGCLSNPGGKRDYALDWCVYHLW